MKQQTEPKQFYVSVALGICILLFGLVIFIAYLINWSEYNAFLTGEVFTVTVREVSKLDDERRWARITFVEDGLEKTSFVEHLRTAEWSELAVGANVTAIQMTNSPSRFILADTLEQRTPPTILTGMVYFLPVLIGLLSISATLFYKRLGWNKTQLRVLDHRLFFALVGGMITFLGIVALADVFYQRPDNLAIYGGGLLVSAMMLAFGLYLLKRGWQVAEKG